MNNVAVFDSSKVYASTSSTWLTAAEVESLMVTIQSAYLTWNVTTPAVQEVLAATWSALTDLWVWLVKNSLGWGAVASWGGTGWGGTAADTLTSLLLHWDNVASPSDFLDSSASPKTVTAIGNPIQKSWYGNFNWTAWNNISIPDSSDFDFTSSNWTIDLWLYPTNISAYPWFIGQLNNTDKNWCAYIHVNGAIAVWVSWLNEIKSADWVIVNNKWQHIAIVKNWTSTTIYVDWRNVASATTSVWTNSTYPLLIWGFLSGWANQYFWWYIDEVRISNTARWTSNFDTNLPTWHYDNDANTKLLIHFDWAWSAFTDSSSSNRPITPSWSVTQSSLKIGDWAIYLNWNTSYLSIPASDDITFWSWNFTLETWMNPATVSWWQRIFSQMWSTNSDRSIYLAMNSNKIHLWISTGTVAAFDISFPFNTSISANVWTHIALVRNGSTISLYVNWVKDSVTYNIWTTAIRTSSSNFGVWWWDSAWEYFNWYLDEVRISKWIDRSNWTTFPVPNSAY
ncbi:MAG: Structural protein [uncultured bacterium (gcode 4)]|uniref:Structural protein n=1 Tax=uncultured bacterium (gcode 4) TaxID=1234023 RepID=K2H0X6_9BACT|nr:MAG: Structural protein [uncultured bacterium (gcode 4)]